MGNLTRNFDREEFACKCGCGLANINPFLVGALQLLRDMIANPIIITSGCRCPTHNANEGGASMSHHVFGDAVDFTCEDGFNLAVMANRLLNWGGGFHYYKDSKFIHLDMGPRRRWEG